MIVKAFVLLVNQVFVSVLKIYKDLVPHLIICCRYWSSRGPGTEKNLNSL